MSYTRSRDRLDALGLDALCDLIVDGVSMTKIGRNIEVSVSAMINWIAADDNRSARVKEARMRAALAWDEMALEGIDNATDPFDLSKAKEAAHHLRWRASKIAPRDYGDKVQHTGADDAPLFPSIVVKFDGNGST